MIEFDTPYNLLQKRHSLFYCMVKQTGPKESERLQEIAIKKRNERKIGVLK